MSSIRSLSVVGALLPLAVAAERTFESFNDGWIFEQNGRTASVTLPHDWAIAGPFDANGDANTGMLPWRGEGVYRRTLELPARPAGRVFLDFDGIQGRSIVFVNGEPCAKGEYGYLGFRADATPYLKAGTNTVEVRCDTRLLSSRWYPGAGIYRKVTLVKTDDVFLQDDAIRMRTERKGVSWTLEVEGRAVSRSASATACAIGAELKDAEGRVVARAQGVAPDGAAMAQLEPFDEQPYKLQLTVENPQLWEMVDPAYLYTLAVELKAENGATDRLERRVGFREFSFDADKGFVLNGVRVQLKGIDLHSDLGPLGMAFDKDAMRRQLTVMRDMGANALRTSHNCPAPEVLDLCDEMGFFVWDECFDKWNETCGRGDEPLEDFVSRTLAAWVRRDRMHPSVFAWSIGNEIGLGGDAAVRNGWMGKAEHGTTIERCARFRHAVRNEDPTRPVAIGCCFPEAIGRGDYATLDLTGWNYRELYRDMKKEYPGKPVLYSESGSSFSEYGYYAERRPTNETDYVLSTRNIDSYDRNSAPWADIADREFARMERDRWCCGEFVWTGIDYLGEPSPFTGPTHVRASRSSYFGICDLCALPKDRYYLYRSHWNESAFTLHLVPDHWTFPNRVGGKLPVYVYTSADEAELFVNGRSCGRRRKDPAAGVVKLDKSDVAAYYSILPRYRLMWDDVVYEPGEIKVVAYGEKGEVLGEERLRTARGASSVVLTPERRYGSLVVVKVTLADPSGTPVPADNRRVFFKVKDAEIAAVGNSDPRGLESFKEVTSHSLCNGRAAVYLKVKPGVTATLTATADGVESASVEIR